MWGKSNPDRGNSIGKAQICKGMLEMFEKHQGTIAERAKGRVSYLMALIINHLHCLFMNGAR